MHRGFWLKVRKRENLEYVGVDKRVLLKWIFKKWVGVIIWVDLVQDRDRWRALVNAVMNFRVP